MKEKTDNLRHPIVSYQHTEPTHEAYYLQKNFCVTIYHLLCVLHTQLHKTVQLEYSRVHLIWQQKTKKNKKNYTKQECANYTLNFRLYNFSFMIAHIPAYAASRKPFIHTRTHNIYCTIEINRLRTQSFTIVKNIFDIKQEREKSYAPFIRLNADCRT